ncbi:hypothetical protein ACLB2K_046650 [Fragaria x ananassa]
MPLGLIIGLGRAFRQKRTASLDILSPKRAPRNFYKGKNCKPTGFHTRKGLLCFHSDNAHIYFSKDKCLPLDMSPKLLKILQEEEKLPNYVVPDLTDFKLKPYVSQCPKEVKAAEPAGATK